ncbi:MAG: hybrid sensor histidine kinase/response regulator [Deltaproteobacteria bacterium]|nr:hybrid sensor histidine kinase/response regulator [Deltaproteobacteria bacterium]
MSPSNALAQPVILAVDDEPTNLQIIRMVVQREKLDCRLLLAESAEEGLKLLAENPVDLILLDVVMPGMNGFEMFKKIKTNPDWASVPVVFLSALHEPEYIKTGLEMGASDYIGKPIIAQVLVARIRTVLRIRQLTSQVLLRNKALEDINKLKDEFVSICSHDLRSPLSAILLICQFFQETLEGKSNYPTDILLQRIKNQANLARRLVDSLLDMNRLEEGQRVPAFTLFPVKSMVETCLEDQQPAIHTEGLTVEVSLPVGSIICYGDREMLAQMVRNLLGNALKFAHSKLLVEGRVSGPLDTKGGELLLDIANDGPTISKEQQEAIFQKYFRSDRRKEGMGLGLFICRKFAQAHGGDISVVEREDYPTCFRIRLPMIFHGDSLPDLSSMADSQVMILTASKTQGETLESLLLAAGMVEVNHLQGDDGWKEVLGKQPDIAVVDLQASADMYADILKAANAGAKKTAWIFLGGREEQETLASLGLSHFHFLSSPVNPREYIDLVGKAALLGRQPTVSA